MTSLKNALVGITSLGIGSVIALAILAIALAIKIGIVALIVYGVLIVLEWLGADLPWVIITAL